MADNDISVHEVEYLSVSTGKIDDEPVVIITVRPELPSFRPHNLSIARSQAERLFEDLKTILSRSAVWLVLVALAGCSADVEVERETTSATAEPESLTTERSRTAVSVDLLRDQGPVLTEDGRPIDVPHDGVLVVEGCLHIHETLVIYLNEGDRDSERVAVEVVREWANGGCR